LLVACAEPTKAPPQRDKGSSAEPTKAAQSDAVSRYQRGEWAFNSADGRVRFEAYAARCAAMPATPPSGATITLLFRDGQGIKIEYRGLTARYPCRFAWGMPWDTPPDGACALQDVTAFASLWRRLSELDLFSIKTREMPSPSPHRGGWALGVRFPGRCRARLHIEVVGLSASGSPAASASSRTGASRTSKASISSVSRQRVS
jgi:hypothetical protein